MMLISMSSITVSMRCQSSKTECTEFVASSNCPLSVLSGAAVVCSYNNKKSGVGEISACFFIYQLFALPV